VEMVLEQPLFLREPQIADAVQEFEQQAKSVQPIARRPLKPPSSSDADHGTCYTSGTSGTPDTGIPGIPGPHDELGPSTSIPGISPTAAIPYPCP
jgi:hypothetical protein